MRASELMIGDLVNLSPSDTPAHNYVKIHAIDYDREISKDYVYDIAFLSTGAMQYNYPTSSLKPIPLTEAFMQKNFPTPEEIVWWPLNDGSFRVEMQDDTHLIIGKYNYVHELQHALRLFGKEGEIEL